MKGLKMKKYYIYFVVVLMAVSFMAIGIGCTQPEAATSAATTAAATTAAATTAAATTAAAETTAAAKVITIGLAMPGVNVPYFVTYVKVYQEQCDALGVNLVITDAEWDPVKQANQVDDLISQKVSAIVVVPADAAAIVAPIKKAREAGFIVVSSNVMPNQEGLQYINSFTGPSCWEQAKILAEYAVKNLKDSGKLDDGGNFVEITGVPGYSAAVDRSGGFKEKLTQIAPDIKMLAQQPSNWMKEEAYNVMQNFIVAYGDKIDAVHAHDDSSAAGAIQAIEEAGYKSGTDILVWGYGASIEGIANIQSGKMNATIGQPPSIDAKLSVEITLKLINGEQVAAFNYMDMPIVDINNVADFAPGEW
jgi:ribose transport system substrate-binding protein